MTGLEKIIQQIECEAQTASDQILSEADSECAEILAGAQATCGEISAEASAQAASIRQDVLSRGESGCQMQRKNRILAAKQEMIAAVIEKSKEALLHMESVDYFVMLTRQIERYAQQGDGVVYLSEADLARVPAYFPKKLSQIAEAKGGTLALSAQPKELSGGFVLAYGGVEENCSFDALFEADRERLQDLVRAKLFA